MHHRALLRLLAAIALHASLAPRLAHAQTPGAASCPDGMAVSADTAGHCCWPGQAWSNTRQTCVGTPACPPGTVAQGEACLSLQSTASVPVAPVPATPAPVAACMPGQLVTADTNGQCCWPAQVWSHARQTCVGVPLCPAGLYAQGESCVAAPVAPVTYGAFGIPHQRRVLQPYDGGPIPPGAHLTTRRRGGLIGGGAAMFGAGYLVAIIAASVSIALEAQYSGRDARCLGYAEWGYVPVVGPLVGLAISVADDCARTGSNFDLYVALATVDEVLQLGGIALLAMGLLRPRHYIEYATEHAHHRPVIADVTLAPYAPGAAVGASLSITTF